MRILSKFCYEWKRPERKAARKGILPGGSGAV